MLYDNVVNIAESVTMPTQTHGQEPSRSYGEPAGVRLVAVLEGVGTEPFTVAQAVHEGAALGLSSRYAVDLLHRLAASGWVTRIKKGVYAINDSVTKMPKTHVFAIGTAVVAPSTVSHWSALQYWGLTEQIPATVTLSSPRRTFPVPDEAGSASSCHPQAKCLWPQLPPRLCFGLGLGNKSPLAEVHLARGQVDGKMNQKGVALTKLCNGEAIRTVRWGLPLPRLHQDYPSKLSLSGQAPSPGPRTWHSPPPERLWPPLPG